MHRWR
ncbi:hypothetical protein E2C01_080387 [Portunus trituberculatus]